MELGSLLISSSAESTVSGAFPVRRLRNDRGLLTVSGDGDFLPNSIFPGLIVVGVSGFAAGLVEFGATGSTSFGGAFELEASSTAFEVFRAGSSTLLFGGEDLGAGVMAFDVAASGDFGGAFETAFGVVGSGKPGVFGVAGIGDRGDGA